MLSKLLERKEDADKKAFGTFAGVFTPTVLTILGVILFLREGWVVGNAGLLGAWAIILIAFAITTLTALSMSSITTNIRIGAGGAFSIISQSLGLEMGGSIGIPLYLAQTLAVTMYVFGFREGWLWIFPQHPPLLVDMCIFLLLFSIAYVSAKVAFKIQYLILAILAISLFSVFITFFTNPVDNPIQWIGDFPGSPENGFSGVSFWIVFAIFFPAATGILAGANMSGELKKPRRSIPVGTLSAIAISFVIYMVMAYWFARVATPQELASNYTIMIDKAFYGPVVLAGLLAATLSSALTSLVGAPRILQALAHHQVLPKSKWVSKKSRSNEPRNAMIITGLIVLGTIFLRDLNFVAPLLTMFFLITYAMINLVVLIEQNLSLVSFRPLFRIPPFVSFLGTLGCIFSMFVINPTFSLVALIVVFSIYGFLLRRNLKAPFGDVRSGLFVSLAAWAAKKAAKLPSSQERAWKPNLLVPVKNISKTGRHLRIIYDITTPHGDVNFLSITDEDSSPDIWRELKRLSGTLNKRDIFSTWVIIKSESFISGLKYSMRILKRTFFGPNIVFLPLEDYLEDGKELCQIIREARIDKMGVIASHLHPELELGRKSVVNLWIKDMGPEWKLDMHMPNMDLAILIAYKIKENWNARLNLVTVIEDEDQVEEAKEYLENMIDLARISGRVTVRVINDDFASALVKSDIADLNIFGLEANPSLERINQISAKVDSSCLFVRDSGEESAFA